MDVADAVFGIETRDTPVPRTLLAGGAYRWSSMFDGPKPDWYLDPDYNHAEWNRTWGAWMFGYRPTIEELAAVD